MHFLMKKTALIAMAAVLCFAACDKEEGKSLSPDKQKSYIQDVAVEAIEMLDIDNWKPQANIIAGTIGEKGALSNAKPDANLDAWAKGFEDITELRLSAIKGAFTVRDGVVSRADSDKLTLDYSINGVLPCHAEIVVEDSEMAIALPEDFFDDAESDSAYEQYRIKPLTPDAEPSQPVMLWIPKSIDASLTAAGEEGLRMHIGADINMAGAEPTPYDTYSISYSFQSGDYTVSLDKAYYSPTEIEYSSSFKKGQTTILAGSFLAKGELAWRQWEDDYAVDKNATTGTIEVSASLLDKVSVNGLVDYTKYIKLVNTASITSEAEAKKFARDLEKCFDISLSCKGSKQARLGFAYLGEEGIQPVIRFEDGSSYQLPEEYFSEDAFYGVIEAADNLMSRIEDTFVELGLLKKENIEPSAE